MRFLRLTFVLAVAVLALPACDISGSDPGSFEVSVSGDATASFSGEPITIINPDAALGSSERRYQFRLAVPGYTTASAADSQIATISVGSEDGPDLTEGTYSVGRFGLDFGPSRAEATVGTERGRTFLSLSGKITLTGVTSDRVWGSFEFDAIEGGDGDDEVTVRGSFEADLEENTIS